MEIPPPPANLPSPPFHNVSGIANLRDIGGYSCPAPSSSKTSATDSNASSYSIAKNLIYRSADPSRVTPSGLSQLRELGIRVVFDLRSMPEVMRRGKEWEGVDKDLKPFRERSDDISKDQGKNRGDEKDESVVERVWTPVFSEQDYSPEKIALRYKDYASASDEGFVNAYREILKHAGPAYSVILRHIAAPEPVGCLVHCTAGKDRTGLLVALLYLLCGVQTETIVKEYALTDLGLASMKPLFRERLLQNPALKGNERGVDNMTSSKEQNMRGTIEMLNREFGGAEEYCRNVLGLTEQELDSLRKNMVVSKPGTSL
ncbi:hypothetical protein MBLNU457_1388t1 [Dothideomycetes sp. NU457]